MVHAHGVEQAAVALGKVEELRAVHDRALSPAELGERDADGIGAVGRHGGGDRLAGMILRLSLNFNVGPGSRGAVLGAARGVFGGGDGQFRHLAALPLRMEPSQEWHAPLAARSGAEAFGQLAGHARLLPLHEVHQLALADTEAEADVVVGVH